MKPTKVVLKALLRAPDRTLDRDTLLREVADRGVREKAVDRALSSLVGSGRVVEVRPGVFRGIKDRDLRVGRILVTRKGYGFVELPEGDVYVRARDMGGALHRDVVAVRTFSTRGDRRAGEVAYVVERANDTLVGRFERHGRVGVVVPSDRRIRAEVLVTPDRTMDARRGDMVVARVTRFPTTRDAAQGVVEEVIGPEGAPGVGVEVIIREHALRTGFPGDVLEEAAEIPVELPEPEASRRDLRDLYTVTVDPVDARDFDDAVSIERRDGGFRLWVHVADVAHYVPWGSTIDEEAVKRATSVYLVDRVLPMLPERLSNGVCSLRPDEDRFAMTVMADVDRQGLVERYELFDSIIRSDRRLSYDEVDGWLEADSGFPDAESERLLTTLEELAAILGERRVQRGGLDFETVEAKVLLDEEGAPYDVVLRRRTVATNMIEESMILANEVVARHMVAKEAPMVFRIHEDPDPEALQRIAVILREFDYPIKDVRDASPKTFQRIVKHAHGRSEQLLINSLLLRALQRARYVDFQHSHFGLASEAYTHFTSPIRRYPDLIVHRLLKAQLRGGLGSDGAPEGVGSMVRELEWLCEHASEAEREAEAAENDSVEFKLTELMAQHIGEEYEGVITGVTGFGMFVQLPNTAEGLVHVERMTDDYYRYDAERFRLEGEKHGRRFRLGQTVRVRVADVSVAEGRIDLEVA